MRQHSHIGNLKDIRTICSVQRMAVEMKIEGALARLRDLDRERNAAGDVLSACQAGWRQAVSGMSFQLTAVNFWSAEILRIEAEIETIEGLVDNVQAERRALCQEQNALSARGDAVGDLLRSALRDEQKWRDEAAMDEYFGRARMKGRFD